jgi:hypothetical protein
MFSIRQQSSRSSGLVASFPNCANRAITLQGTLLSFWRGSTAQFFKKYASTGFGNYLGVGNCTVG